MAKFQIPGWNMSLIIWWITSLAISQANGMTSSEKEELRLKVIEMFDHAYGSYMDNAYPADELMPLSCKGRYRGTRPSRGDVDDALGNFSLTLVDTLDTLAVLGKITEFEDAVRLVIRDVQFDNDIVVSVFETNIRILGGLIGGHVMAAYYKKTNRGFTWYKDELLEKAKDVGYRLLPAFNTTTGIPYPRVNLRYGLRHGVARTGHERDTCTACAGTMVLEFAALSRLSGEPIFEEKARKAMNFLWKQRHRSSDLVGTVINIHTGDWIRRESGVGAGIDSYYEYLLKAYILLGDETYLDRFNKHYDAVMKYVSQGPMLVDVHMHKPLTNSRNFMDALLAFWPGLQVLKGDIKPAIEMHEMLYQVMQRHNFLPEAFTTDFRVHWAQHPLRPEFIESTYFLYKATSDPYYLHVGKSVIEKLEQHARVQCGYAALKDVTSGRKEDQMDSFVLAEMFKYLYLLFSEPENLSFDIDDYIFTTEAHMLPLSLSVYSTVPNNTGDPIPAHVYEDEEAEGRFLRSCPNTNHLFPGNADYAHSIRSPLKNMVESVCPRPKSRKKPPIRANEFIAGNKEQLDQLRKMGIRIVTMKDGRVQLLHTAAEAETPEDAEAGMLFMQDMIDLSKQQAAEVQQDPRVVQLLSHPHLGNTVLSAGPAQFGYDLKMSEGLYGNVILSPSIKGCQPLEQIEEIKGKILVLERGECMFIDKARHIEAAGALAGIVMDHNEGTSSDTAPLFAMSGDGKTDVKIPMVFLFNKQGKELREAIRESPGGLSVFLGLKAVPMDETMKYLRENQMPGDPILGVQPPEVPSAQKQDDIFIKKLDIGIMQLQFAKKGPWTKESEKLMDIVEGRQSATEDIVTKDTNSKMGKVLDEVVVLLKQHTNFNNIEQPGYLKAIGDVVEAAFQGPKDTELNSESRALLERLGQELKPADNAEIITRVRSDPDMDDVSVTLVRKSPEKKDETQNKERNIKEEVRQAPDWMNLKDGELYVDKDGVLFVADLDKFLNGQGVVPPNIFHKVQEDAHTIIFGEDDGSSSMTSRSPGEAPSLVPTVNDPPGTSNIHSSLDASSQDSKAQGTADSTSANDDIIITQSSPNARTGTNTKCDNDDKVAQGDQRSRSNSENESGAPNVQESAVQSEDSSSDSGIDSDVEYSVHADDIHQFTKENPSAEQERTTEHDNHKKNEL